MTRLCVVTAHRITNLKTLLADDGAPGGSSYELATWFGALVGCVTATGCHDTWTPVPVACRRCAPAHYRVTAVRRVGPGIEWLCLSCRASGTLMDWQDCVFDLSGFTQSEGDDGNTVPLFARLDELTWLRPYTGEARTRGDERRGDMLRFVLSSALVEREHVVLAVGKRELTALLECAEHAAQDADGKERHALERFVGRCDAVLGLLDSESARGRVVLH